MPIYNKVDSMAYIYKITSPSKRVYIGSTVNIKSRKRDYKKNRCKRQRKIYYSILKYGWEKHSFEVIEEVPFEDKFIRERHWQEVYNAVEDGLNCLYVKTDQKPRRMSEESRMLMSKNSGARNKSKEWQAKITASIQGKKHTEESKLKMRMTKLGKKESKETREKKRQMRLGKKHSPETIEKIRKNNLGKKKPGKKVLQFTLEGELIKEWKNVTEIYNETSFNKNYLRDAARGLYDNKAKGFIWKYKE